MARFHWHAEPPPDDAGLAADLALGFSSQAAAEDWLGTFYDDLAAAGSARVTLCEDNRPILGPMDLQP